MPGLDKGVLEKIDPSILLSRVRLDIGSDFILAPHYNAIFLQAADELWEEAHSQLKSGRYNPELPLTINVPKERGFTRPGSILQPIDRLVYQALTDLMLPTLEEQLDRTRAFSNIPTIPVSTDSLFQASRNSWENFQNKLVKLCDQDGYIVKADVANYFERIPQHHLINLIHASGVQSEIVKLLEEILLAFQERDSFGIIQGVFPSDILGNFYLTDLDAFCELNDIPSARYVDDLYLKFETKAEATRGLTELISRLRQDGLHLNEYKSGIWKSRKLISEETAVDHLFEEAFAEVEKELKEKNSLEEVGGYGFQVNWELRKSYEEVDEEKIHLAAVIKLYESIEEFPEQADKIEKFCLPILRVAHSEAAVEKAIERSVKRPHLIRLYQSYLSRFTPYSEDVVGKLEELINGDKLVLDYQVMYVLAALMGSEKVNQSTVKSALQILNNGEVAQETRAIAAIFAAKFGTPQQRRLVRVAYEKEPSSYVRAAILHSAKYFTTPEQKTCIRAWGGHNTINALIAKALKSQ